jgi:NADH-quinone oxidoreductase subunit N
MYGKEADQEATKTPFVFYAVAVVSILLNIILGLFPSVVLDLLG